MKYEIILALPYYEREIYLLKVGERFLMVYKSSGLAGNDSKGTILPFLWISNGSMYGQIGWIVKAFVREGKAQRYYSKDLSTFPGNIPLFLSKLTEDLADYNVEQTEFTNDMKNIREVVKDINDQINDVIKDETYLLDLKNV